MCIMQMKIMNIKINMEYHVILQIKNILFKIYFI